MSSPAGRSANPEAAASGVTRAPGGEAEAGARSASGQDATLYLHPQTLARLKTFELRAKMIIEGVTSG